MKNPVRTGLILPFSVPRPNREKDIFMRIVILIILAMMVVITVVRILIRYDGFYIVDKENKKTPVKHDMAQLAISGFIAGCFFIILLEILFQMI